MRVSVIIVEPFEFTDIQYISIQKGANQHGQTRIKGFIREDLENIYVNMSLSKTSVKLVGADFSGNKRVLFQGILEDLNINVENGQKVMELSIMSYSRLLDIKREVRVFQNPTLPYNELVCAVLAPFNNAKAIINTGDGKPIGEMFVQYHETAWEFLVRIASMRNDVVAYNDTQNDIHIYFGFPKKTASNAPPLNPIYFEVRKNVGDYIYKRDNNVLNISENDAVCYIIKERTVREIGDQVSFQRRTLFIAAIESLWEGQELVNHYTLISKNATKVPQSRNFGLIGASLDGEVSAVSGSMVKMNLSAAHQNDAGLVKWHPFSTVYSSPDGSGWYAMPKAGDRLRLYFPTEIDNDGYTISAVHLNVGNASSGNADVITTDGEVSPRTQEEKKLISNEFGKEIELTPTTIRISSGGKSIMIDDEKGIFITSDMDIEIKSKEDITVSSVHGSVVIVGDETVSIEQKDAQIELNEENIVFKGSRVETE
jgi:hypothetical protein